MARPLLRRPRLALADEPTGALDAVDAEAVLGSLRALTDDGCAVILATHSREVADSCDLGVHLGEIAQQGGGHGGSMPTVTATTDLDTDVGTALRVNLDLDVQVVAFRRHAVHPVPGPGLRTGGRIGDGERVRWSARLLGVVPVRHTSEVTVLEDGHDRARFVDVMVSGAFASYRHRHTFTHLATGATRQLDEMSWTSPLGVLGRLADAVVLRRVMAALLRARNAEVLRRVTSTST